MMFPVSVRRPANRNTATNRGVSLTLFKVCERSDQYLFITRIRNLTSHPFFFFGVEGGERKHHVTTI